MNIHSFSVTDIMDIDTDPYDIAVDNNGFLYVTPGSGQWEYLKVYSMKDKKEIRHSPGYSIFQDHNILYNKNNGKLYLHGRHALELFEIENGEIKKRYTAYSGNISTKGFGEITPDGKNYYSLGGNVFNSIPSNSGDFLYNFTFGREYNDFEFSEVDQLTFAAHKIRGIDVYEYGTNKFLYPLRKDLNVQKLLYQNGILITINKDKNGNNFIETMSAATQPNNEIPNVNWTTDPSGTLESLGFKPNDIAMDPNKPVLYMTSLNSNTIYAVNVKTGDIKSLGLPDRAERLELHHNKLYITQRRDASAFLENSPIGAIAEVDTTTFNIKKIIEVDTDPLDIAIDEKGYVYISPGHSNRTNVVSYNLENGYEVPVYNGTGSSYMGTGKNIFYVPSLTKLYSINTESWPMYVEAYEVDSGMIGQDYPAPYRRESYSLTPYVKISPDGSTLLNGNGVALELTKYKSGDMLFKYRLGRGYKDFAFNMQDQLTYAVRKDMGIDVYQYNTDIYLYTIRKDLRVQNIFYQNGNLIIVGMNNSSNHYMKTFSAQTTGIQDPPKSGGPLSLLKGEALSTKGNQTLPPVKSLPIDTTFAYYFNQPIEIDPTKIELVGPGGKIEFNSEVKSNILYIYPKVLYPSIDYTLTINWDAISGGVSQNLNYNQITVFKTEDKILKGFQTIGGKKYYFDTKGVKQTGWQTISGKKYYFGTKGIMHTGWETISGKRYHFSTKGIMQTGWQTISGKKYYFSTKGIMQTGWETISDKKYYFSTKGTMQTGWQMISGKKYYFNTKGIMLTGWQMISGKKYYFNTKGIMLTGRQTISGKKYYFNTKGFMQKS
ncbi:hypothetical protein [Robertmurraya mangrovi]|uniref:hypothetical protein n=1 Tax=Robertmurraya mangrovi TaxID=3098077 RepID=UPI002ACC193D|nr:hypothetical protein [Bacillus sp. 31A1R]